MKIKTQAWEPDTCEAPACRIIQLWDVDVAAEAREFRLAAVERVCAAHAAAVPTGVLLWWDGNWKPFTEYIEYQRAWYRRLNFIEWERDHPTEAMPSTIAGHTSDPITTGSVPAPPAEAIDAMARVLAWNQRDNARKNQGISIAVSIHPDLDRLAVTWTFTGAGEDRVLALACPLTADERLQAQEIADIQFGTGLVSFK